MTTTGPTRRDRSSQGGTRTARHQHPRRARPSTGNTVLNVTRFVAALLALVTVLLGPPLLFTAIAGNPFDIPETLRHTSVLTSPVDDQTILWLLTTLAWLAWLHLLAHLVVEALSQTRGLQLRMPAAGLLFGGNQLLASHLVAALLVGSSASSVTGLTTAPATHTVTTAPMHGSVMTPTLRPVALVEGTVEATTAEGLAGTPSQRARAEARAGLLECQVLPPQGRHHDTLWDIAERHLGDGLRWREIYALNEGREMPGGERLTRASLIRPGWILTLPADAKVLPIDSVAPPDITGPVQPVEQGTVGAPDQQPEPPVTAAQAPTTDVPASTTADAGEVPQPLHVPPVAVPREELPRLEPTLPAVTTPAAATPSAQAPPAPASGSTELNNRAGAEQVATTGLLGLAAVGLLTALTRRRKIAARRRPPGTRAATPHPDLLGEEAVLRREARSAADITAAVRLTLLLAARSGTDLHLSAVWHHSNDSLELVHATAEGTAPLEAPAPFVSTPRGWLLPASARRFLFATSRSTTVTDRLSAQLQHQTDPFPVLLPVGTQDGSTCLVNLEPLGLVSLHPATATASDSETASDGADAALAEVLVAWTQQLAAAPWFELSRIRLAPRYADGAVASARADVLTPEDLATLRAAARHHAQAEPDRGSALTGPDRSDPWDGIATAPDILLGFAAADLPEDLLAAAADPHQPLCAILTTPHPAATIWTLHVDGTMHLPGIADRLVPTRLTAERLARLQALLEHAQDPPHATTDDPGVRARDNNNPPTPQPHERTAAARPAIALTDPDARSTATHGQGNTDETVDADHVDDMRTPAVTVESPATRTTPSPVATPGNSSDPIDPNPADEDPVVPTEPAEADLPGEAEVSLEVPLVRIDVLGPLSITGARITLGDTMRQIAVYLSLHRRPVQPRTLWEAINPDREFNDHALRSRLNELKGHLWDQLEKDGRGRMLADTVRCDWQEFRALADGDDNDKMAALSLVRGRPFEDFQPDWVYLEGYATDLEAAIVDLALDVATRALARGDNATASLAAAAGLKASPYEERLAQLGIRAASQRGAHHLARALHRQLSVVLDEEICPEDNEQPDTTALMRQVTDLEHAERNRLSGRD